MLNLTNLTPVLTAEALLRRIARGCEFSGDGFRFSKYKQDFGGSVCDPKIVRGGLGVAEMGAEEEEACDVDGSVRSGAVCARQLSVASTCQ
jgi:hypothetical protein